MPINVASFASLAQCLPCLIAGCLLTSPSFPFLLPDELCFDTHYYAGPACIERQSALWRSVGHGSYGIFGYWIVWSLQPAATMGFWALSSARRHQWVSAWVYSTLGFLLKMWPAVLWPLFLIQEWRETGHWCFDRLLSVVAAEGVIILGQSVLDPGQRLKSLKYLWYRPVNIASTPGVLARWLGDHHLIFSYGAVNVVGPLPTDLATGIFLLGAVFGLGILWLLAEGKTTLTDASILAVGLLLVAMKVSSPQYLIWWVPLLALRRGTPILPIAFALTG